MVAGPMKYFIEDLNRIQTASNLAHRLSRPKQVAETATDVTQYSFGYMKHPTLEQYAAMIDESLEIPIHQFIKDSLNAGNGVSVYFNSFYETEEEAGIKKDLIVNSSRVKIIDIVPDEWVETSYETLEANGWFEVQEI